MAGVIPVSSEQVRRPAGGVFAPEGRAIPSWTALL